MSGVGSQTYGRPQSLYKSIMTSGVMASLVLRLQPLELFTTSHSVWKFITAVIPNSYFIFTVTCSTCRGQLPSQTRGSTLEPINKSCLWLLNCHDKDLACVACNNEIQRLLASAMDPFHISMTDRKMQVNAGVINIMGLASAPCRIAEPIQ